MGESIRLQKILAQAGCGSRRACEVFITDGRVTVDSVIVRQLGSKADPETQTIELDGNKVAGPGKLAKGVKASGEHVYWMLNKPKGVLCTNEDPSGRPLAVQMVPEKRRVFCVGRLDKDTEGLILLTNDGELTNQLTHPRYGVEKVYIARVDGRALPQQIAKLQKGVHLAEGKTQGARVRLRKSAGSQSILELCISEGMNRQVRRMLAAVGLYVRGLKRVSVGPVRLGEIGPGESRQLTGEELDRLRAAIRNAQNEAEAPAAKIVERDTDDEDEDQDEDRVPQKAKKDKRDRAEKTEAKEPGEKRKRRDAEHKAKHEKQDGDEQPKRRKSWPSEATQEELEDLDEAAGTRTAMAPVDDDGSTTQEAPAVSDVAGDATQAARAIDKELEGDDSDEDDSEFGLDDDELSEAETAPQQPILDEVEDDDDGDDEDEDGLIIKRKKNLNAAAALEEDEDTTELVASIDDDDDEDGDAILDEDDEDHTPFESAGSKGGKGEKKWVDRGDIDDPRMNAAAAEKEHKEEDRMARKRQQSAAREASTAGKPRVNSRGGAGGDRSGKGGRNFKPREDRPYQSRGGPGGKGGAGGDRGDRGPRQYGDRPNRGGSGGSDRDRSEHYRPRSGPKFSGPRRDSPAFDKRKTWGEVSGGGRPERSEGGGERRFEKRDGGRPDWKKSGPRDGERKPYGDRKPYAGGGDRGPRPQNREGGNWRDKREGGAPRGDRPYQKKSYGDRPQGGGQGRPYGGGGGRPDRGGQDRRGPRPEWRGSSSGGPGVRKPDSRGGDGPRGGGDRGNFKPRPWENKSRGGSGGGGGRGPDRGDRGGSGQRQSRPWEKREPRGGGEGGDE